MGPIALFDKSFLQSLSVNESVWFDNFFLTVICPIFYVETLADLDKSVRDGRTPEQEVEIIAEKFPDMHGTPCPYHGDMCIGNLLGNDVPMTKQIPLMHGRMVKSEGKTGVVFGLSREAEAFTRWQRREFMEIDRLYAKLWRASLSALDLNMVTRNFRKLGIDSKSCKTLEDAKALADSIVSDRVRPAYCMELALLFLSVPRQCHQSIRETWKKANYSPLVEYAPYAAYVLTVEIFFQIALAAKLISTVRQSNRIDIAYLFYLPFCMVFVSSDRLHSRIAPLFLHKDQQFLWGPDLKEGLSQLNNYYSRFPDDVKERGVLSFTDRPPQDAGYFVAQVWDRHFPGWREQEEIVTAGKSIDVAEMRKLIDAPALPPDKIDFKPKNADCLSIKRLVRKKKGSWYQVPKGLKGSDG